MRTKLDFYIFIQREFEDIKCAIIICKSKDRQRNGQQKKEQKDKQRSTKHYAENKRSSNTNTTENRWWNHVFRKGKQFMFY